MNHDQEERMQEEREINEHGSSTRSNSSFFPEMNLVMMLASLSLSNRELECEDMDKPRPTEQDLKALVSKVKTQKRELDRPKIPDRRATRFQTRVLDSRYGRKM